MTTRGRVNLLHKGKGHYKKLLRVELSYVNCLSCYRAIYIKHPLLQYSATHTLNLLWVIA